MPNLREKVVCLRPVDPRVLSERWAKRVVEPILSYLIYLALGAGCAILVALRLAFEIPQAFLQGGMVGMLILVGLAIIALTIWGISWSERATSLRCEVHQTYRRAQSLPSVEARRRYRQDALSWFECHGLVGLERRWYLWTKSEWQDFAKVYTQLQEMNVEDSQPMMPWLDMPTGYVGSAQTPDRTAPSVPEAVIISAERQQETAQAS